jgi:hypothetical protein
VSVFKIKIEGGNYEVKIEKVRDTDRFYADALMRNLSHSKDACDL